MKNQNNEDNVQNDGLKVILVGEMGSGKTSLINVCVGNKFNLNEKSSNSASFVIKETKIFGKIYTIHLWDTMGQEKYHALTKIFIKNSHIVILTYDITNRNSFEKLNYWYTETQNILGKDVIYAVVGNKTDLFIKEEVHEDEVNKYCKGKNMPYKLTTALNPLTFTEFLDKLIVKYFKKFGGRIEGPVGSQLSIQIEDEKKKKCC